MYGGSSVYDPSFLMDRDVVVVTINYRLGPLGKVNSFSPLNAYRSKVDKTFAM